MLNEDFMPIDPQSPEYRGGITPSTEPIDRLDRIRRILAIRTGGPSPRSSGPAD